MLRYVYLIIKYTIYFSYITFLSSNFSSSYNECIDVTIERLSVKSYKRLDIYQCSILSVVFRSKNLVKKSSCKMTELGFHK